MFRVVERPAHGGDIEELLRSADVALVTSATLMGVSNMGIGGSGGMAVAALVCCALACTMLVAAPARAHAQDDLLGPDKPLHFAVSTLLSLGSYSFAASLDAGRDLRFAAAFAVPI